MRGFNKNLPSGELALVNMKPYFSLMQGLCTVLLLKTATSILAELLFISTLLNKHYLQDPNQRLAMRKVTHANFETFLNTSVVLNANAIYQFQEDAELLFIRCRTRILCTEDPDVILNIGMWYWSKNAVIPYVGFAYKDFQLGLSYDVTISKFNQASIKTKNI